MQTGIVSFCDRKEVVHLKNELECGSKNLQTKSSADVFNLEKYCISDPVKTGRTPPRWTLRQAGTEYTDEPEIACRW